MNYSIVIRTKNSQKTIKNCLTSILKQSLLPKEIIVVDSGSTDSTIKEMSNFQVKLLHYPKGVPFNYSKALNLGISEVKTEFVLILSSHVELINENQVEWMCYRLKNEQNCAAISTLRSDVKNYYSTIKFKWDKITLENFNGRAMYNFCSLIELPLWKEYNFNEQIPSCEDQEWALRYLKKNYFTIVISCPPIFYSNPYYNLKKDLQDTIVLGEFIYPKMISNFYVKQLFKRGLKNMRKKEYKLGINRIYIAVGILKHKYIRKYNFNSVYSKSLK